MTSDSRFKEYTPDNPLTGSCFRSVGKKQLHFARFFIPDLINSDT
ncbi:hypothetical protein D1BOALGB6SA_2335 [Olavius sp. associated proteobacterium Delta 1]|nr:hypothetical protein D1BOALGB6SA_2335 [Olavius sp. associated proteobacterium Delta 1]